ncbi:type II toxin-antitoxin system RelE/ParE family toxin [Flavobacterium sp.]|uniref:type II toxin-antitoxin system RelE/ParE family toxin n=1 Tax=Flavobacterium sp. TaxID=239 RepID=UPI00286E243B|nr:type II toxin-antitoxin system RelE/ParE family toxin [Flavobacterium sp.]
MVFKIVISVLAESEIEETIEFYENRKKGLGKQFLEYFRGYLKILKTNPELFSIKKPPLYRELALKKFPFVIIYEIFQNEVIIYSVFHTSRNPTKKP